MPALAFLLKYIGWPGILLALLYFYEEGVPGAHRIPFLSGIPIVGDLATGRVHAYAAEQVKIALASSEARCRSEKEQMASEAEVSALRARADREARLRAAADVANTEAQRRAAMTQAALEKSEAELEVLSAEAATVPGLTVPGQEDWKWLQEH